MICLFGMHMGTFWRGLGSCDERLRVFVRRGMEIATEATLVTL